MLKYVKVSVILLSVFALNTAHAADTAVNNNNANYNDINLISPAKVPLTDKEIEGLYLANKWKNSPTKPIKSSDGSVMYLFSATLPTLICTPLEVCTIKLQPGETVTDLHSGDSTRWKVSPAVSGSGSVITTHIVVKPVDAGLETNLFITTDRRSYMIKLVSDVKQWIPVLSFIYPDDQDLDWANYKKAIDPNRTQILPSGQNLAALDFNYRISGSRATWRPTRVYTDGQKTYIEIPGNGIIGEAPALVAIGDDGGLFKKASQQLINYRVIGNRYVVDKVITKAALISGVGLKQKKVYIIRGRK